MDWWRGIFEEINPLPLMRRTVRCNYFALELVNSRIESPLVKQKCTDENMRSKKNGQQPSKGILLTSSVCGRGMNTGLSRCPSTSFQAQDTQSLFPGLCFLPSQYFPVSDSRDWMYCLSEHRLLWWWDQNVVFRSALAYLTLCSDRQVGAWSSPKAIKEL